VVASGRPWLRARRRPPIHRSLIAFIRAEEFTRRIEQVVRPWERQILLLQTIPGAASQWTVVGVVPALPG